MFSGDSISSNEDAANLSNLQLPVKFKQLQCDFQDDMFDTDFDDDDGIEIFFFFSPYTYLSNRRLYRGEN